METIDHALQYLQDQAKKQGYEVEVIFNPIRKKKEIDKIEKFISALKQDNKIELPSNIYKSKDVFFEYYYNISGFLNKKWFCLTLMSMKKPELKEFKISSVSEDIPNLQKYLKTITDINFKIS